MVFYVYHLHNSFTHNDLLLLKKHHTVKAHFYPATQSTFKTALNQLWLLVMSLVCIPFCKHVYVWFADYHSLIPVMIARLLGKKSYIVIGGYDSAKLPEINYGAHLKPIRHKFVALSCKWATRLLCVSEFTAQNLKQNVPYPLDAKIQTVYNGIEADMFTYNRNSAPPEPSVICVAKAPDKRTYLRKGIDFLIEIAAKMPGYNFTIIGLSGQAIKIFEEQKNQLALSNIKALTQVPRVQFPALLNKASVMVLPSRYETFGMVLTEAMACGCMPMAWSHTGAGEIIAAAGLNPTKPYLIEQAVQQIETLHQATPQQRQQMRAVVLAHFSLEVREQQLQQILK